MEIKKIKQTKVFGREIKTSLGKIEEHVKVLPESIASEMNQKGFESNGPQIWVYNGADGNPTTEFDLLVGYPVAAEAMDVDITALEEFNCATLIHNGAWHKLSESYQKVIGEVMQNGLQMTGECREIYHQVDFENVENNLTEIQIGIL